MERILRIQQSLESLETIIGETVAVILNGDFESLWRGKALNFNLDRDFRCAGIQRIGYRLEEHLHQGGVREEEFDRVGRLDVHVN